MKVLLWVEGFWPHIGGVAVICSQYVLALKRRGYDCMIVTSRHRRELPARDSFHGVPVYRLPFSQALAHRDMREISAVQQQVTELKQWAPDIIHFHECGPSVIFHLFTRSACHAPCIMTAHSLLPQTTGSQGLLIRMLHSVDWITAVSQAMLDDLHHLAPELAERSSLIHDGLETPPQSPTDLGPEAFAAPRLLCVGRVVQDKGFDVALAAFARIFSRFPRARLIIAGDGNARPELEKHAEQLGVRAAVDMLGWVPPEDVPALLSTATMLIVPSRWREPFGLVAVEAGQMARPVIATRVGGLPEIVRHKESGLLVENQDAEGLAKAVTFLLEHPDIAREMGRAGLKRARTEFTMDRFADSHVLLYQQLAGARSQESA